MKKFCLFFSLIVFSFLFVGCSFNKNFKKSISEIHENLFACEDENFFATLSLGKRENPYVVDGKSEPLVDFAVLTAHKINTKLRAHEASFVLKTNAQTYAGEFEVNPFDGSFVVDLKSIETDFSNITLEIIADGKSHQYVFENQISSQVAKATDIIKIAQSEFSQISSAIQKKNKFCAEVYVRLIKQKGFKPLWYVSVVCDNGQLFALIVDPVTKDVIAKNF